MEILLKQSGNPLKISWQRQGEDFELEWLEKKFSGKILKWEAPHFNLQIEDEILSGYFYRGEDFVDVHLPSGTYRFNYSSSKRARLRGSHEAGDLLAPMPGKVLRLLVKQSQMVKKGDTLLILEAMKMEHQIKSPMDGEIVKIAYQQGERVKEGEELIELRAK